MSNPTSAAPIAIDRMNIARFSRLDLATAYVERCTKSHAIMMGDDERFWVVTMADAARLADAGYEWA